ncbi:MAG: hypothetical protein QW757_03845, partial [Candidatus Woesearchaeota archaeon]
DGENSLKILEIAIKYNKPKKINYYGFDLFESMDEKTFQKEISKNPLSQKSIYEKLKKDDTIKNKKKLALTTHVYLAKGMLKIANNYINNFIQKNFKYPKTNNKKIPILFSGGVANNSIITSIMLEQNVLINEKVPCGDGGICLGQVYLSNILK